MASIFLSILLFFFLLLLSSFFSGSETAIFSTTELSLKKLKKDTKLSSKLIIKMLQKPMELLIVILTGNLFVNISLSTVSNDLAMNSFGPWGPIITILVLTPIILFIAEIIPKNIALNHTDSFRRLVIRPIYYFSIIIAPIRFAISKIIVVIFAAFHISDKQSIYSYSKEELESSVKLGQREGILEDTEGRYILNIMKMEHREAQHVMIHRNETVFIEYGSSINQAVSLFRQHKKSCLPVYKRDRDHIHGFLFLKDIIPIKFGLGRASNINRLIKQAHFFPYKKDLIELLQDFRNLGIRTAILLDEFGGTAGIVTLKDIISNIMGYDPLLDPQKKVQRKGKSSFKIMTDILLSDFNEIFLTDLNSPNSETLNGLLLEYFEKIPKTGETIVINNNRFTALSVSDNKIEEVLYKR